MPRARRLKVFQAQIGFYDTVVAVPSQPAALKAWGLRQDLFASGHAKVAEDPQAIAAALEHPDIPLKRAVGTGDPFELEARPQAQPPSSSAKDRPLKARAKAAKPPPPKPPADRGPLDAAQSALEAHESAWARDEAALIRRREELEAEITEARAAHADARKAARAAIAEARSAYRKAGGRD
jgi:hypothetical protein